MSLTEDVRSEVPAVWATALEKALAPIDPTGKVAEYVVTGQHAEALTSIKRDPWRDLCWWLALRHVLGHEVGDDAAAKAMVTLYAGFGEVDAAVLRRWGMVLDFARKVFGWRVTFDDVADRHWPGLMLYQAECSSPAGPLPFTFADLQRIAAEDGVSAADLVRLAIPNRYIRRRECLPRLAGFADAVVDHRDIAVPMLVSGSVDERLDTMRLLEALGDTVLVALAEPLAVAATSVSAQVRDAARPLVARTGDTAVEPLRRLARDGKPAQRGHALELLAARPDQRAWAIETACADRAASVRGLVARWEAVDAPPEMDEELLLPSLPSLPSWALSTEDAGQVANQVFEAIGQAIDSQNRRSAAIYQSHPNFGQFQPTPAPPRSTIDSFARLLAADSPPPCDNKLNGINSAYWPDQLISLIRKHGYPAATAIQVMAAVGWFDPDGRGYRPWAAVMDEVHARTGGPDLLTVQRMLDAIGADGRELIWSSYSSPWGVRLGRDWPDEDVWPFVAYNLDWILEESSVRQEQSGNTHGLFAAIATLPRPPARLVDRLCTLATGPRKSDRLPAQEALAREPQRAARAAAALQDGKADTRLAAAQWLTRIADPAALPALQAAWKKEKQDVVRGALLDALIALGENAGTYLDPEGTAATAAKAVAKGMPTSIAWLDWETVPEVTWASSGETVPRAVVQWLCLTAVKTKSPEPNAVLRHYATLFDTAGRERLAACLLAAWLSEDVRPHTQPEAEAKAAREASAYYQWYSSPDGQYAGMSMEQVTAALLPRYLKEPAGSATASKGLLAVVAACGGRDVVPPAERYLKEWFGYRMPQGKALLAMLAWVEHPSALQVLLAIGTRFRTQGLQGEAARLAGTVAERKGWTVDELADRTIPTAGFDDEGILELPYGPRTFTAVLRPDLTVELRDPDRKVIKALPSPRQSDDAELAKETKKTFLAAKKELKSIATLQTQRLYEAMCTERSWPVEDWKRYLLRHPIAGPAVRRLVWVASVDDQPPVIFRPLDDGTLTDSGDDDVELPDDARIRLAHDSALSPDEVERWTAHLADYEITPLFQQLGRGVHDLTPEVRSRQELTDFTGHLLESFALRGRATKLGYTRGPAEDNGWVSRYEKRFPTLGITAEVHFTGTTLPEENRVVALQELTFRRETAGRWGQLTLGDVPAVLVSECWNDMRLLSAEGTGFDPDWEKKASY